MMRALVALAFILTTMTLTIMGVQAFEVPH